MLLSGLMVAALAANSSRGRPPDEVQGQSPSRAGADPVALDPTTFSPSGCLLLPSASARSVRPTVALDAGHGGPDPGASGTDRAGRLYREKDLTLQLTSSTAERLRARGIDVVLTRTTDALGTPLRSTDLGSGGLTTEASQKDLSSRVRCANLAQADALVSIHLNSYDDSSAAGTETLYEAHRSDASPNLALAREVHGRVRSGLAELGSTSPDRGIVDDSVRGDAGGSHLVLLGPRVEGYIDEPSAMPATLLEPLFITNRDDLTRVTGPGGSDVLAASIATGIETYLARTP